MINEQLKTGENMIMRQPSGCVLWENDVSASSNPLLRFENINRRKGQLTKRKKNIGPTVP